MSSRSPKPPVPPPPPSDSLAEKPERKNENLNSSIAPSPIVASHAEGKSFPHVMNEQISKAGADASTKGVVTGKVLSDGQAIGETKTTLSAEAAATSKPPATQEEMYKTEIERSDSKKDALGVSSKADGAPPEPRSTARSGSGSQDDMRAIRPAVESSKVSNGDRDARNTESGQWRGSRRGSRDRSRSRSRGRRRDRSRSRSRDGSRDRSRDRSRRSRSRSRGRSREYSRSCSPGSSYDNRRRRRDRSVSSGDSRDYGYSRDGGRRERGRSYDRHRSRSSSRSRSPRRDYYRGPSHSPRRRRGSPGYRRDSGYRNSHYSSERHWSPASDRRGERYRSPVRRGGYAPSGRDRKRRRGSGDAALDGNRELRTVFVWRLVQAVTEADVFEFFSRAGKVRDVQLVMERRSTRHKGSGYVEFYSQDSVKRAVALAGGSIHGFPVAVKPSSDENAVVGNGMDMGLNGAMPVPGPPPPSLHSAGAPSGQVPMAAVGWSMTARQPVPQIPSAAESKLSAERGGNGTSSAPTALVSVQELAVLLNPNNLPVPPAPQGSLAAMEQVPLPLVANKAAGAAQPGASFFTRLYIGSVPFQLGEDDLRNIFKPFGAITSLQLQRDASTGRSRGYGFVEYADHSSAKKALAIDGLDVAGRPLKVALASHDSRAPILPRATALAPAAPAIQGSQLREVTGELDEGREGGVSMSASQKASLRERLSRGESMVSGPDGALPTAQIPSKSLLLGNMFDPSSEAAGFEQELAEDVRDECASKYGTVTHLFVDKSSRGLVYIRFASIAIAGKALLSLNGRWFGGKRISAAYVSDVEYKKRFTDAPV